MFILRALLCCSIFSVFSDGNGDHRASMPGYQHWILSMVRTGFAGWIWLWATITHMSPPVHVPNSMHASRLIKGDGKPLHVAFAFLYEKRIGMCMCAGALLLVFRLTLMDIVWV